MKDFAGPKRDQLATLRAHEEGPDRRSISLVKPLEDRVPPPMELLLNQLAEPVRCATRSISSLLPSWSRSVWWPAFLRHASHLLHCDHNIPALSEGVFAFSVPCQNISLYEPELSLSLSQDEREGAEVYPKQSSLERSF